MIQIWKGKMEYFDEVLDSFFACGIKYKADRKNWTIEVDKNQVALANSILMEVNMELEAGW